MLRLAMSSDPTSDPTLKTVVIERVRVLVALEIVLGEQRQEHLPVERQRGDDTHQDDGEPKFVVVPDVPEAFDDLTLLLRDPLVQVQVRGTNHQKRNEHRDERCGVGDEAPADADTVDEPRCERRADDP